LTFAVHPYFFARKALTRWLVAGAVLTFTAIAIGAESAAIAPPALSDRIVAVVNDAPVTLVELNQRATALARENKTPVTPAFKAQVLELLIAQRAQVQRAQQEGIVIGERDVDVAEATVAGNNRLSVEALHEAVVREGLSVKTFRQQLADQLILQRMRERLLAGVARPSQAEIDAYLDEQQALTNEKAPVQVHLAQLFIPVPENAAASDLAAVDAQKQAIDVALKRGEAFDALAKAQSKSPDAAQGGDMGVRAVGDYPPLFVEATQGLAVGGVSPWIRSGAGFHLLKVLARPVAKVTMTSIQTRARHILLTVGPDLSQEQAIERLNGFRAQVVSGRRDFGALAKANSQDGSAAYGGDLGWVAPGIFVPEFEGPMNQLNPGEVSQPVVSRFGVHLIQVLERKQVPLGEEAQNEAISEILKARKADEAFAKWSEDVRLRAYVDIRDLGAE
jgi:peptidyl-prolyl cis-trans isomerase SurA